MIISMLLMIGAAILCKLNLMKIEMIGFVIPLLPICLVAGNEQLKSIDKTYFDINESTQQGDTLVSASHADSPQLSGCNLDSCCYGEMEFGRFKKNGPAKARLLKRNSGNFSYLHT